MEVRHAAWRTREASGSGQNRCYATYGFLDGEDPARAQVRGGEADGHAEHAREHEENEHRDVRREIVQGALERRTV